MRKLRFEGNAWGGGQSLRRLRKCKVLVSWGLIHLIYVLDEAVYFFKVRFTSILPSFVSVKGYRFPIELRDMIIGDI